MYIEPEVIEDIYYEWEKTRRKKKTEIVNNKGASIMFNNKDLSEEKCQD